MARTVRQGEEIKVLRGMLPICMHCKRIRDERDQWERMETCISDHSEALFSHRLCPTCAREHYGDLADPG